jgi:hypothetical protein
MLGVIKPEKHCKHNRFYRKQRQPDAGVKDIRSPAMRPKAD